MESTVLVLIASSLSVLFGWQPMPDDDQRAEYIVQIDPELAATLHEGQAIPITCDIPKDIGPIGRIRIVVGRDPLPQISRTVNLKPWPEEAAGKGLIQTQFNSSASESVNTGSRYGNLSGQGAKQIFPPTAGNTGGANPSGVSASNPFARTSQPGATEVSNVAEKAKRQILPPPRGREQLFGKSNANGNVRTAMNNGADQVGNELRRGASQFTKQAEGRLRQVGNDLEQGAKKTMNEFGRSLLPDRSNASRDAGVSDRLAGSGRINSEILPSTLSGNGQNAPKSNAAPGYPPKSRRIDRPVYEQDNQQRRTSLPMDVAARQPATTPISEARTNPSSNPGEFLSEAGWPETGVAAPIGTHVADHRQGNDLELQPARQDAPWSPRTLERDDREERRARSEVAYTPSGRDTNSVDNKSADDFDRTAYEDLGYENSGRGFGTDRPRRNRGAEIRSPEYEEQSESNDNKGGVFPMLLSWVLLTCSGVGNVYLWWSYVDVRGKYRGVVHGSSPRHRNRYDD